MLNISSGISAMTAALEKSYQDFTQNIATTRSAYSLAEPAIAQARDISDTAKPITRDDILRLESVLRTYYRSYCDRSGALLQSVRAAAAKGNELIEGFRLDYAYDSEASVDYLKSLRAFRNLDVSIVGRVVRDQGDVGEILRQCSSIAENLKAVPVRIRFERLGQQNAEFIAILSDVILAIEEANKTFKGLGERQMYDAQVQ